MKSLDQSIGGLAKNSKRKAPMSFHLRRINKDVEFFLK